MAIKVRGLSKLSKDLDRIGRNLKTGAEQGTNVAAKNLASQITSSTPVDSGALQDSVHAESNRVIIGSSEINYAEVVEENEPFIRPVIDQMSSEIVSDIVDAIRREL
jgi:hypothetical protein